MAHLSADTAIVYLSMPGSQPDKGFLSMHPEKDKDLNDFLFVGIGNRAPILRYETIMLCHSDFYGLEFSSGEETPSQHEPVGNPVSKLIH